MTYLRNAINTRETPQNAPLPHHPQQVLNSAGGYVFAVDNWTRLERFLILGTERGTYYIEEREVTAKNAAAVIACLKEDGPRVVRTTVEISAAGRAAKNDPALFVLALASSPAFADRSTVSSALAALPRVARTATHLCTFAAFIDNLRGWGRGLRSAVADWYLSMPASELAHQMLKYQQRSGWSHRDLLRLAHPEPETPAHNALFQWAVDGTLGHLATPQLLDGELDQLRAFETAKKASSEFEIVNLIEDHRLTHEMIPSQWKNSPRVWEALLEAMPYTAMLRNLGKLTEVGLLRPQSPATGLVVARLIDRKRVANSRVHPIALLAALLLTAAQAAAQLSGGLSVLSDYRFRGISLSDRQPALQGWLAYDHPSGLYAGALLSTVRLYAASDEVAADVYAGYAHALSSRASVDASVARYVYPTSRLLGDYDFNEVSVGAAVDRLRTRLYFSNDYLGRGNDSVYAEVEAALVLTTKLSLVGRVGELWRGGDAPNRPTGPPRFQTDGKVGLVWGVAGFALEASFVATDIPKDRCPGSNRACEPGALLALSREF